HRQNDDQQEEQSESPAKAHESLHLSLDRQPAGYPCPRDAAFILRSVTGAIAQLGERLDRTQEVGGSSPPSSIASLVLTRWPSTVGYVVLDVSGHLRASQTSTSASRNLAVRSCLK